MLAALPLATVFVWLCFLYGWESWGHVTPWLFTDELQNAQLSRAIASTGHAARRGVPYGFQTLYNYGLAPAWWLAGANTAYGVIKVIGVITMTSAVFPAYALARLVVRPRAALFAATATAAIPSLVFSSMLLEEPAAYPYATLCFFLIAKALMTRSRRWIAVAVVASLIAPSVRGELAMIPATFLLAVAFLAWTGERARAWRSGWSRGDWLGAAVLLVGVLIVGNAAISTQSHEWLIATGYYKIRMFRYGLWAAGALTIGLGVIPVVAGLAAPFPTRGRTKPRAERTFAAVLAGGVIAFGWYTAIKAAYISTVFSTLVEERNLIYVSPLLFVATACWLERPRLRLWALAGATAFVLYLILTTPYKMEFHFYADSPGLGILQAANRNLAWTPIIAKIALLSLLAATVVLLLLPRLVRRSRAAVRGTLAFTALAVLAWNVTAQVSAASGSNAFSNDLATNVEHPLSWVDAANGGASTLYLGQSIKDANGLWLLEFWNRSIHHVWSLDGTAPGPGPVVTPDIVGIDGELTQVPDVRYAVLEEGVNLAGTVVATHKHLDGQSVKTWRLVRLALPLRIAEAATGISSDGWVTSLDGKAPARSGYSQYVTPGSRPGFVNVTVSREAWGGKDVPGNVTIQVGKLVIGKNHQPQLGRVTQVRAWVVHSHGARTFRIPTPSPPFRVRLSISPTFVPHDLDPRNTDNRHFGAQVGYSFQAR
ncbi:MAG: hypothetical protein ACR2MU_06090 [Gaiellaceae bacterium]